MKEKSLAIGVMGILALGLVGVLDALVAGENAGVLSLALSFAVVIALILAIAWNARSVRATWGLLSMANGGLSFLIVFASAVFPAASAPYEDGGNGLRSVDLTPPIVGRLREAVASGYFAIAVIIAGMMFLAMAYVLLQLGENSRHHAH